MTDFYGIMLYGSNWRRLCGSPGRTCPLNPKSKTKDAGKHPLAVKKPATKKPAKKPVRQTLPGAVANMLFDFADNQFVDNVEYNTDEIYEICEGYLIKVKERTANRIVAV